MDSGWDTEHCQPPQRKMAGSRGRTMAHRCLTALPWLGNLLGEEFIQRFIHQHYTLLCTRGVYPTTWRNKLTLKDNTISYYLLCSYLADAATFLASDLSYFPLRTACLFCCRKNIFWSFIINTVNIKILSSVFEFIAPKKWCPCSIELCPHVYVCLFLKKDNVTCGLIGECIFVRHVWVCVLVGRRFSSLSSNENLVAPLLSQTSEAFVKCALSSCLQLFLPSHGDTHSQTTPHLPRHSSYVMNIHQTAEGDVSPFFFFFFYPSSRSSFPECFLGALELQWHCRSRVGAAETRCRSSLGDFSQSIASVSSQMICALWAFRSGGFLWALINTRGGICKCRF